MMYRFIYMISDIYVNILDNYYRNLKMISENVVVLCCSIYFRARLIRLCMFCSVLSVQYLSPDVARDNLSGGVG